MSDRVSLQPSGAWIFVDTDAAPMMMGYASTLATDGCGARPQPIGFRGAAPGQSADERGKPRVRVKAKGIPT